MAVERPRIAAVVLNWKDTQSTTDCVGSLLREALIDEIYVVDNESSGALTHLAGPRVTLFEEPENLGFSRGVNRGLRHALARDIDAVLVINNDAVINSGTMPALLVDFEAHRSSLGLIAPIVRNPDGTVQSSGGRLRLIDFATSDLAGGRSLDYLTWACVLVPVDTLREIGLLDEAYFMYWEDVDFGRRVRESGRRLVLSQEASVVHARSASHGRAGAAIDRYGARGVMVYAIRSRSVRVWLGAVPRLVAKGMRRLLAGDLERTRAVLRGVKDARQATNSIAAPGRMDR